MRIQVNKLTLPCLLMPWMALGLWGESTRVGRASEDVAAPSWTSRLPEQETKQTLWFNLWYSVIATENKVRHVVKSIQVFLLCLPFGFQCLPLSGALKPTLLVPGKCWSTAELQPYLVLYGAPPLSEILSAGLRLALGPELPAPSSFSSCWIYAYVPPYLAISISSLNHFFFLSLFLLWWLNVAMQPLQYFVA